MWRKFLGIGIPLLVLGIIFYVIGVAQLNTWYGDAGGGASALMTIGVILGIIGGMLTNAGLIGAAIGADVRTAARAAAASMPAGRAASMLAGPPTASKDQTGE